MGLTAHNGVITRHCACGKTSQLPIAQLHKDGKCRKCKEAFGPPASALSLDTKTFDKLLTMSKVPMLVDFWATWCAPCKQVAPHVERVAASLAGEVLVVKVNTEDNPALSARYVVTSIPSFLVLKKGKAVDQRTGAMDAGEMELWVKSVLAR